MDNVYKKFYDNFYMRTNGFIPTKPLNQNMYPGDFFQIRNGEIVLLGNIFRNNLIQVDNCEFEYNIKLNPANWMFNEGVTKPYSGRGSGHNPFFFRGNNPESVKILNWNELQQELIIKLTQTIFSFREIYVVTECAVTSDWTLAIAGSEHAELEIATESENFGLVDLFGDNAARTIQAKEIEFYHREEKRKPAFFKAKKLVVQPEQLEVFISELIIDRSKHSEWVSTFFDFDFHHDSLNFSAPVSMNAQACILDMLQANQLNPNTALLYFAWADANMDDIAKLFTTYGN